MPKAEPPPADPRREAIETLAGLFADHFPTSRQGPRLIGREAEYPVVTPEGAPGDVRQVLETLAQSGDFEEIREGDLLVELVGEEVRFALEVGWGTVEIIGGPCQSLQQMADQHERAMSQLLDATESLGLWVLAYGIQPLQPGSLELMSPKKRYGILHEEIGDTWLYFTSTASDQLHVDISRDELPLALNIGNLLTPALIALCANSPVCAGEESGFCSAREGLMGQIHAASARHGMTPRPVHDVIEWIELAAAQRYLIHKDPETGVYSRPDDGSFGDYLASHGADFDAFLTHDHYIWNSARARTAHGTIELRAGCQQPWASHMSVAALGLGIIEAATTLQTWLTAQLGDDLWPTMRAYGHDVVRKGIAANEPFDGFLRGVLDRCTAALEQRDTPDEEGIWLTPLYHRLEKQACPAQEALEAFRQEGMAGLLNHTRVVKPPS